jgi:hypothetical protein
MRQLLVAVKVLSGVDRSLDDAIAAVSAFRYLFAFADREASGRGLLFWSAWYDAWLMGDDLGLDHTGIGIERIGDSDLELDLVDSDWSKIRSAANAAHQHDEQRWLYWHLREACRTHEADNSRARLLFAREVHGGSIDDGEALGREHMSSR